MSNPLISIVIAVYNVEDYIKKCLLSIEKQKMNFEVIIIDDGSTDESGKICDLWSFNKDYAFVYHQTNQGISKARNNGVKNSRASYVTFVDPDDWISDDYTETVERLIKSNGGINAVDAVGINYSRVRQNKYGELIATKAELQYPKEHTNGAEVTRWIIETKADSYTWQYIVKKQVYLDNNIIFPDMILYEDAATLYRLLFFSRKVILTNISLYSYFQRSDSFVNSATVSRTTEYLSLFDSMDNFFNKQNRPDLIELGKEYRLTRLFTAYANMVRLDLDNNLKKQHYRKISRLINKNFVLKPIHRVTFIKQVLFYTHLFKLFTRIHDRIE